ncbi:TetR/AcrR family transcriptional regulator [Aestuariirhabdus sp. Z084]|uniref:TetR/AcrR family transcriptional regulator n=1 Tax=Aestuariirhabdus haliotis TaxID=2918751 RepID=UPI00201B3C3B|nr:TetR/AcrR family transcriptional regulator [Aestuariirhabdus haliotis]MCL6414175.1 TetR/AcrR family transcriptional regulator [Aestuariirhabdus haliotis]MCL6418107.1 TetR/AcrR family transcriptional regulator [Aestuariirhabdus haliotis]
MAKPKTRERILQASLALFNEVGERNVSTNHIAAELGMSPGNLYYHFRNKQQIIYELYLGYEAEVKQTLQLPEGRPLTLEDKRGYLEGIFDGMWRFRFFHRDLEHMLECDGQLRASYRQLAQHCLAQGKAIYQGLVDAGYLQASEEEVEALSYNSWILMTSWVSFLRTVVQDEGDTTLTSAMIRRGIYQIMALERVFLTEFARDQIRPMEQDFFAPLDADGTALREQKTAVSAEP